MRREGADRVRFPAMKHLLMIPFCLLLAAPVCAQGDKPKDKDKKPIAERKDDKDTVNDKAVVAIDKFIKGEGKPTKDTDWRQHLKMPPKLEFDENAEYFWHMQTNKGDITIRLMPLTLPVIGGRILNTEMP